MKFESKKNREDTKNNLYIKNLPAKPENEVKEMLTKKFEAFGDISSLLVKMDKGTEKLFAFICFKDNRAAEEAHKLNETDVFETGEKIYINWA